MGARLTTPIRSDPATGQPSWPGTLRYELRWCSRAPQHRRLTPAGQGFLYDGPHGPAYADAERDRMRIHGPVRLECREPLTQMRDALEHGGVTLQGDRDVLRLRRYEPMSWRSGRILHVLAGDRELLLFSWLSRGVVIERPDGHIITRLPRNVNGRGELAGDAVALEVALLLAFHASFLAGALAPLRSWRAWAAVAR